MGKWMVRRLWRTYESVTGWLRWWPLAYQIRTAHGVDYPWWVKVFGNGCALIERMCPEKERVRHWVRVYGWRRTLWHIWDDYIAVVLMGGLVWVFLGSYIWAFWRVWQCGQ